jgi:hypothetical protein
MAPAAADDAETDGCNPGTTRGKRLLAYLKARKNPNAVAHKFSKCDKMSLIMTTGMSFQWGKGGVSRITDAKSDVVASSECGDPDFVGPCPFHSLACWQGYTHTKIMAWKVKLGETWLRMEWCEDGVSVTNGKIVDANGWVSWPGASYLGTERGGAELKHDYRAYSLHRIHWGYKDVSIPRNWCNQIRGGTAYGEPPHFRRLGTCNTADNA